MALPVYEMIINPDETSDVEVSFVALVDKPAIERNFLAFNSQQLYFKTDEDKRIIAGPAMVADTLIYRRDDKGEYNVFFSADTVKQIALKFAKKGYAKNLNLFHDPALPAEGVTIFNSFVSDKSIGIQPMKGFEDLPDGSWFISAKVENEEIWQKIKNGEVRGFSVEGNFSFTKDRTGGQNSHLPQNGFMSDILDAIKNGIADIKKSLFDTNVPPPAAPVLPAAQSALKTKGGVEVQVDKMEIGGKVTIAGAPAPAGEHELEDGTKITVGEGGVITAIIPATAAPVAQTPEQQMQAVKDAVQKFAVGSPEERMTNLETVAKALMEYSFGWQIREANEKALRDQAIEVYKTGFAEHKQKLADAEAKLAKQSEVIKAIFSIVEQLANAPSADPASASPKNFNTEKELTKEERRRELADLLSKAKS